MARQRCQETARSLLDKTCKFALTCLGRHQTNTRYLVGFQCGTLDPTPLTARIFPGLTCLLTSSIAGRRHYPTGPLLYVGQVGVLGLQTSTPDCSTVRVLNLVFRSYPGMYPGMMYPGTPQNVFRTKARPLRHCQ